MAKNIIRLTESDLHRIVKESARRIIREIIGNSSPNGYEFDYDTGQVKRNQGGAFGGSELDKMRDEELYRKQKIERERRENPSYQDKKDWCFKYEDYLREMCPGYWRGGEYEIMYDRYRNQLGA